MLEITRGRAKNPVVAEELIDVLRPLTLDGSLYVGFPILATTDVPITVDALLVTKQHGLVAFSFSEPLRTIRMIQPLVFAFAQPRPTFHGRRE